MRKTGYIHSLDDVAPATAAALVDRAAALRPILISKMTQCEAEGRLSAEISDLMVEAGIYRACKSRRFGGYEYGPSVMFDIGFELGRGCGSSS